MHVQHDQGVHTVSGEIEKGGQISHLSLASLGTRSDITGGPPREGGKRAVNPERFPLDKAKTQDKNPIGESC